ncbi:MAG TPA: hypothetical protein VGD42_00125 [Lysobacter sp.]
MRTLGYALLILGFAWIAGQQIEGSMRGELRSVVLVEYAKLSPDRIYSEEDVKQHVRMTALAAYRTYPQVGVPGLFMLIGGLLLARSTRGRNDRPKTPQT